MNTISKIFGLAALTGLVTGSVYGYSLSLSDTHTLSDVMNLGVTYGLGSANGAAVILGTLSDRIFKPT